MAMNHERTGREDAAGLASSLSSAVSSSPQAGPERQLAGWKRHAWTWLWLALWGPVPALNWLAFLGALRVRALPPELRWLLLGFLGLQLLSAGFTPTPLVGLGVGLLRGLFLIGLVVTGWLLGSARALSALLPGLVAVLITALAYSALHGNLLHSRLSHPSYQMVSLGLAAALTLWLAVFWPRALGGRARNWIRGGAVLLALTVLLLGGSRAPLMAALLGVAVAAAMTRRRGPTRRTAWKPMALAALLAGGGAALWATQAQERLPSAAGAHLTQLGLNSRDTYWEEAANVFRASPLGGSGVGQLGSRVLSTQENCFQGGQTQTVGCPAWMLKLGAQPWFAPARKLSWLAHNVALQNLAETGVVGAAGYFLVLGLVVAAAFATRRPLLIAAVTGYSVVNLFDNSTMLPSLAVSEVFWLVGGVALREVYRQGVWPGQVRSGRTRFHSTVAGRASVWGGGLLLVSLVPVLLPYLIPSSAVPPALLALNVARSGAVEGQTTLHLGLGSLPGPVRLRLERCAPVCGVERVQDIAPDSRLEWWGALPFPELSPGTTLKLQVLPPETSLLSARPLGEFVWQGP